MRTLWIMLKDLVRAIGGMLGAVLVIGSGLAMISVPLTLMEQRSPLGNALFWYGVVLWTVLFVLGSIWWVGSAHERTKLTGKRRK